MRLLFVAVALAGMAAVAAAGMLAQSDRDDADRGAVPRTELRITVWPTGRDGEARHWTLRCAPPGGSLPNAAAACRAIRENRAAFRAVAPETICTQIFGGPQVATVRGVLSGRRISAAFARNNGCEIARWNRLSKLFAGAG